MQSTSGLSSSRLPMVVTAIALVLALIGIGGIATGAADKPDDDDLASTVGDSTTTTTLDSATTLLPGVPAPTTGPGRTATTATPPGPTTSRPPTPTTVNDACPLPPPATADPGPHTPPAIGTYTYASCSDSSDTTDEKVAAGESGNGVTRRSVSTNEMGTATVAYGPGGVLFERLSVTSPQGNFTCDWNPDVMYYPATMRVGSEWNTKSSCDLKDSKGASPGKLNIDATGKVTGKVAVTIGNTTVNTWAVEGTIKLTTAVAFGTNSVTIISKAYYSPSHGLAVFRHSEQQSGQRSEVHDERLTSLTPKP